MTGRSVKARAGSGWVSPRARGGRRPGLTLVEVLVVLLVVAIVTAITLTALRSARQSAAETKSLADLRSGVGLFLSWSHDRQGEFLNYQRDPRRYAMRCEPWRGGEYCVQWESQRLKWPASYFWTTGERAEVQSFEYSFTFLSDPALWKLDPTPRMLGFGAARHFRPTFTREVLYPSEKAMLLIQVASVRKPAAFVDGSAAIILPASILPQTDGINSMNYPSDPPTPGYSTIDGVRGRDATR